MGIVAAICASLCGAAPVSDSLLVQIRSPVSVRRGLTTILPCWLNPPKSADGLEVRWYRPDQFDAPVMLYREKKFEHVSQDAQYTGRVSFGLRGAASSGGLTTGDLSLQLVNVTLRDAGDYTCYVSSDQGYDSASVSLVVTEKGTFPLLSAVWTDDNSVNVSCESEGWHPEPDLRWSFPMQQQDLTPRSLQRGTDVSGLMSVHSWILVSSPTELSCSVGLSRDSEEAKEARVSLGNAPQLGYGSSAAGWVAFGILLLAMLIAGLLGVLYQNNKSNTAGSGNYNAAENQQLLSEVSVADLGSVKQHYVNVALNKGENKYLKIKDGKLRDAADNDFPDGQKVTCLTAIKGKQGFSSGQHYWEVSLANPTIGVKQSWWLGVTSANVIPQDLDFSPTASNGYLFLSSSPDRTDSLQLSTEPNVFLHVCSRPKKVGVYLNYDKGELSFYDVENKRFIGSFTAVFSGEVFPFFNPGKGDQAPMEIIPRTG